MSFKAAVTSSDGTAVDLHFGGATRFYIFAVDDNGAAVADEVKTIIRETESAGCDGGREFARCGEFGAGGELDGDRGCGGHGHTPKSVQSVVDALPGCQYILTAKIGNKPHMFLQKAGITALESPPDIMDALSKLYKYHAKYHAKREYQQ